MSKFELWDTPCPHCGQVQNEKVYVSVNAGRIRDAGDKLIDGSWNRIRCHACGAHFYPESRLVYTHLEEKLWIVQYPRTFRLRFHELETEVARVFDLEYLQRPPPAIRAQAEGATRRVCFGRPQLVEKLLLHRWGVDDRLAECFKLLLLRDHIGDWFEFGPVEAQFVARQDKQLQLTLFRVDTSEAVYHYTIPETAPLLDDNVTADFKSSHPELFTHLFVSVDRYLNA